MGRVVCRKLLTDPVASLVSDRESGEQCAAQGIGKDVPTHKPSELDSAWISVGHQVGSRSG